MDFMVLTNFKHGIIITLWYDQVHFRDIFWKPSKVFLHNRNPVCLYFFILICYSCQKSVGSWLSHDIDFNVTEGHKLFKSLGYERSASSDALLRVISSHDYTFDCFLYGLINIVSWKVKQPCSKIYFILIVPQKLA